MSARYARAVFEQHDDIDLFGSDAAKGFRSERPNSPSCTHLARCISPRQEGVKPVNVSFDFINQVLLDKRLSVASFKLWYFLKERADAEGKSFHGHRSISSIIQIRRPSLKKYISELVKYGYLRVEHRKKTSDLYTLITPENGWIQNVATVATNCSHPLDTKRIHSTLNLSTLNLKQPPISPLQMNTQPVLFKDDSLKVDFAIEIYKAYPRHITKPGWHRVQAIKEIRKALKEVKPEWLLKKTQEYAEARKDQDEQYTPYAAKWFREKRFNDEPSDWKDQFKKASKTNGHKSIETQKAELLHILRKVGCEDLA